MQAGTVLGQAQLKLELELYLTSFKICCIELIKLVKLRKFGGATLFILQNLKWPIYIIASHGISWRLGAGYLGCYLDCMN